MQFCLNILKKYCLNRGFFLRVLGLFRHLRQSYSLKICSQVFSLTSWFISHAENNRHPDHIEFQQFKHPVRVIDVIFVYRTTMMELWQRICPFMYLCISIDIYAKKAQTSAPFSQTFLFYYLQFYSHSTTGALIPCFPLDLCRLCGIFCPYCAVISDLSNFLEPL